jgi:hypothetical protein
VPVLHLATPPTTAPVIRGLRTRSGRFVGSQRAA